MIAEQPPVVFGDDVFVWSSCSEHGRIRQEFFERDTESLPITPAGPVWDTWATTVMGGNIRLRDRQIPAQKFAHQYEVLPSVHESFKDWRMNSFNLRMWTFRVLGWFLISDLDHCGGGH